jgi:hypothetical protein
MIIEVCQTKANIKKEFEIYCDDELRFTGRQADISEYAPAVLFNPDESVRFESRSSRSGRWRNRLIGWLFTATMFVTIISTNNILQIFLTALIFILIFSRFPNHTKVNHLWDGRDERVGRFSHILSGLLTGYYHLQLGDQKYQVYEKGISHYYHLSVYRGYKQIAQIDQNLHTVNNRDNFRIYLLEEAIELADLLSIFCLYYDNYNHGDHREVFVGHKLNWKWTFSRTDRFYNKDWVALHFPQKAAVAQGRTISN